MLSTCAQRPFSHILPQLTNHHCNKREWMHFQGKQILKLLSFLVEMTMKNKFVTLLLWLFLIKKHKNNNKQTNKQCTSRLIGFLRSQTDQDPHSFPVNRAVVGLDVRKPVFGVSEKARLKPVSSATETT